MMPVSPNALQVIHNTPLRFFYDGSAAVLLFFVLSGFVLNLKYAELQAYPRHWAWVFIIHRIFRIYPAFLASLGLALVFRLWVFSPSAMAPFSEWFSAFWKDPIDWSQMRRLLTLVGPDLHPDFINPPLWSLVLEMRISLLFPLIILLVNRQRRLFWDGCVVVATYAVCFSLARLSSCMYLPHFVLGAMCAKYFGLLEPWLSGFNRGSKVLWLAIALTLYGTAAMTELLQFSNPRAIFMVKQLVGLGATGLILGCASFGSIATLLKQPIFQFIGQTSYSFYLVHMVLQIAVAPLVYHATNSYLVTWGVSLFLAYFTAASFFKFVETPGIILGSRVSKFLAVRLAPISQERGKSVGVVGS